MRPTFRKLEVKDIGTLVRLVAENAEGIEPGLKIVDSRLLLGQAVIDLVGLDAKSSLVLIALDFSADEGLLLRVMDAYSWCLEYPDTLRRLYPMAQAPTARPPRIVFIVERLTDAFLRRIKQLSFLEIDCLEFRHLEVNGASVVYFDLVERLRKSIAPDESSATTSAPVAPAGAPVADGGLEPANEQPLGVEPPIATEPGQASAEPPAVGSVSLVAEPAAALSPVVEAIVGGPGAAPTVEVQAIEGTTSPATIDSRTNGNGTRWSPSVDQPEIDSPVDRDVVGATGETAAPMSAPVAEPLPVEAPAKTALLGAAAPAAPAMPDEPQSVTPTPVQTPVWAKPKAQPNGGGSNFFAHASKGVSPVEAPAAAAVAAPAEPPAPPAATKPGVDDRPELESLSFPKDGLSRQWLEFLSQLGATK